MNETLQIVIVVGVSVGGLYQLLRDDCAQTIITLIAVSLLTAYVFLGAAGWL
jgi:hypothetical protein